MLMTPFSHASQNHETPYLILRNIDKNYKPPYIIYGISIRVDGMWGLGREELS